MCSTPDARIVLLGQAIDELAADTRTGARPATAQSAGMGAEMDGVAERLARIWAMVAELDPGLAERLPRYAAPAD
jgi:hypothetical protein